MHLDGEPDRLTLATRISACYRIHSGGILCSTSLNELIAHGTAKSVVHHSPLVLAIASQSLFRQRKRPICAIDRAITYRRGGLRSIQGSGPVVPAGRREMR